MPDIETITQRLEFMRTCSGATIEDVALQLVALAQANGPNGHVECAYGMTTLIARPTTTVHDIRRQFETAAAKRMWPRLEASMRVAT